MAGRVYACAPVWRGLTCAIAAPGPSLTAGDLARVRAAGLPTVAVTRAWELAPWAQLLYAADKSWWDAYRGVPAFAGLRLVARDDVTFRAVWRLDCRRGDRHRLLPEPDTLGLGQEGANSGNQALQVAAKFGAARVLLLGFDMRRVGARRHWDGDYPDPALRRDSPFDKFVRSFAELAPDLEAAGVEVINCTPGSAIDAFPVRRLDEVL